MRGTGQLLFLSLIVGALITGAAEAVAAPVTPGWRPVAESDLASVPVAQRPPGQRFEVSGDFDGDGKADRAWLMVSENGRLYGLFVSRGGRTPENLADGDLAGLPNLMLDLYRPGTYKTACGKGYGDGGTPCRPAVRARWTAIWLGVFESSDEIFFWDGKRFDSAFLSD